MTTPASSPAEPPAGPREDELASAMFAIGVGLWVFVAALSLVQAVAGGLGDDPTRRLLIGLALLAAPALALVLHEPLFRILCRRRALLVPIAACQLAGASVDGLPNGPYYAACLIPVGLAVIFGPPALVWACAAILDLGYGAAVVANNSIAELERSGDLDAVIGGLLGPPASAWILLRIHHLLVGFEENLDETLDKLAEGQIPVASAELASATRSVLAIPRWTSDPGAPRYADLTPRDLQLAEDLDYGTTADIARRTHYSTSSVDQRVAALMTKVGARTRAHLAALTALPDWPRRR